MDGKDGFMPPPYILFPDPANELEEDCQLPSELPVMH